MDEEKKEVEASSLSVQGEKVKKWLTDHLWIIALVTSFFIFLSLAMPIFTSHPVSVTPIEDGYLINEAGERLDVYADAFFNLGGNYPVLIIYLLVIIGIVFVGLAHLKSDLGVAASLIFLVSGILFLISNSLFDLGNSWHFLDANAIYNGDYAVFSQTAGTELYAGAVIGAVFSFLAAILSFACASKKETFSVANLTEIAVFSALAIALQFIKIEIGATGGSINLGLIPLFFIALRHGPVKGFFASAFVYGIITCVTDGYGFYTYPLDYLVGFGGVAVLGFARQYVFRKDKDFTIPGFFIITGGVIIATLIRYVGSTTSSMVNYGYGFIDALVYNGIYIPVTGAVSLAAMLLLYPAIGRLNRLFPPKNAF